VQEENELERALRLAADDPAQRPDFYRLLIEAQIYVIGETARPGTGSQDLDKGDRVSIQNWQRPDGSPIIPFFTSLPALQRAISEQVSYLCLPARSLFEMTRGASFLLNPKSDYGKELLPGEIEALLSVGTNSMPQTRVVEKQTQVLLGQPKEYPTEMVAALSRFFSRRPNVKAAYLVLMHDPSVDKRPHLLVGMMATGDFEKVSQEAGSVITGTAPRGEPVDIYRVAENDKGLSSYFLREVKPFYEATLVTKLKGLFR